MANLEGEKAPAFSLPAATARSIRCPIMPGRMSFCGFIPRTIPWLNQRSVRVPRRYSAGHTSKRSCLGREPR
jgi:hypothetical protein